MKRIAVVTTVLLLMIMLVPADAAHAAPSTDRIIREGETVNEDLVVFGDRLIVEDGATVNGDVVVFGGEASLGGTINGDVVVLGGEATLSGFVDGDLVTFGGNLDVTSTADVEVNCVVVGGNISGDGVDSISCNSFGEFPNFAIPAFVGPRLPDGPPEPPAPPAPPEVPEVPRLRRTANDGFFSTIGSVIGRSFLLGILALVVAAIAPIQLDQVGHAVARKPAASGAVGLLTAIAGPSLAALLLLVSIVLTIVCIGLLGYPLVLGLVIALVAGTLMGWVAVGTLLGKRLARALKLSNHSLPVVAALGTAVLTLGAGLLSSLPFWFGGWLWWLGAFLLACAGLGAVALTRFGTRPYPPGATTKGEKVAIVMETLPVEEGGPAEK